MRSLVVEALRSVGAETIPMPTTGEPVVVGRLDGASARRLAIYNHVEALHTLRDAARRVRILQFYDDVRPPAEQERTLMTRFPLATDALRRLWEVEHLLGPEHDAAAMRERLLFQPTCNICGLWSGYAGPGSRRSCQRPRVSKWTSGWFLTKNRSGFSRCCVRILTLKGSGTWK